MRRAIQLVENFGRSPASACDAAEALECLRDQDGFLGGRVLPDSPAKPGHRVQAFFEDEDALLPDGMRRVVVPTGLERALFGAEPGR